MRIIKKLLNRLRGVQSIGKFKKRGLRIVNNVFIGAGTIVLPGVTIGDRVIIGAGSVIKNDIPDNSVSLLEFLQKSYIP